MNWEGTGDSTRILRGPDGKPIATVTGTFATVTHNGKTQRMNHADLLAAQAWCAGVLAGLSRHPPPNATGAGDDTHRAALGPRSRGTTPLRKVDDDVPKVPKGNALERLLVVLRKDPDLAWGVCQGAKALGPWVAVGNDWWQRSDATGFNVATVRTMASTHVAGAGAGTGWLWSEFVPTSGHSEEVAAQTAFPTDDLAKVACDEHLRVNGWLLASQPA